MGKSQESDQPSSFFQNLPENWLADLRTVIREEVKCVVKEELEQHEHICRFGQLDSKEIGHFISTMDELGGGSVDKGLIVIRQNHEWLRLQRERSAWISTTLIFIILTAITGGIITATWLGIKQMLGK